MAVLQILVLPFMILNVFGVLSGAIWLAVLGKWSVLGIGLLGMFGAASSIGLALLPGALINMTAVPFLGKRRLWFLGFPFLLARSIYSDAVIGAWCLAVIILIVKKAGADTTLPALLWAYGVAISPLSYMTQRSSGPDDPGFADVLITFAAQVAIILMAIDVLANGLEFRSLIYLCAGTMIVATLVQATVAFLVMRESASATLRDAS
jgi:hypothetical protein